MMVVWGRTSAFVGLKFEQIQTIPASELANVDRRVGLRDGYYVLVVPAHYIGLIHKGSRFEIFDPNVGVARFGNRSDFSKMFTSYFASPDAMREYAIGTEEYQLISFSPV